MQFTDQTRQAIQTALIKEYELLLNGSLAFLKQNFESYQRVVLDNVLYKKEPLELNYESCENFILDSADDVKDIIFGLKSGSGSAWWGNEILFPFSKRMPVLDLYSQGVSPFFLAYRQWQNNLHFICEKEFWLDDENLKDYEAFKKINIFDNILFKSDKLSLYQNKRDFILGKTIWFYYVRALVEMFFPEFKYNTQFSSKKVHRYLLQLKEDVWLGFEYEETEMAYQLRKGTPCLPDYFNLVLIAPSFNKNENVLSYYRKNNPSILSLGLLGNPFFYHPCFPMLGYSAVDTGRNDKNGTPYLRHIIQLDNENYQMIHPAEYGESMKKHAFFYMSLLASTSKIYLDYLNVVLRDVFM